MPQARDQDENDQQGDEGDLSDLLSELRILLPGAQLQHPIRAQAQGGGVKLHGVEQFRVQHIAHGTGVLAATHGLRCLPVGQVGLRAPVALVRAAPVARRAVAKFSSRQQIAQDDGVQPRTGAKVARDVGRGDGKVARARLQGPADAGQGQRREQWDLRAAIGLRADSGPT